jgi:hypothetical protein
MSLYKYWAISSLVAHYFCITLIRAVCQTLSKARSMSLLSYGWNSEVRKYAPMFGPFCWKESRGMLGLKPMLFRSGWEDAACVFVVLSENVLIALISRLVSNFWAIPWVWEIVMPECCENDVVKIGMNFYGLSLKFLFWMTSLPAAFRVNFPL